MMEIRDEKDRVAAHRERRRHESARNSYQRLLSGESTSYRVGGGWGSARGVDGWRVEISPLLRFALLYHMRNEHAMFQNSAPDFEAEASVVYRSAAKVYDATWGRVLPSGFPARAFSNYDQIIGLDECTGERGG